MTRDYKPAARKKQAPSSGAGSSLLVGILIGLLLGLAIALGVAIYLNKVPGAFLSRSKPTEPVPAEKADKSSDKGAKATKGADAAAKAEAKSEEKPRFDFYNILPGEDTAKSKPAPAAPAATESATEPKEIFFLQAGAFQNMSDAENMKARLALLGMETTIQATTSGDRTLHRVRIGPFSKVDEVNRARDTLKQNGIESTLIKGREKAH